MLINIQVFTATGTYTPTAGTARVVVECMGGGGGGGGVVATAAGQGTVASGGAAGALALGMVKDGFSGVTVTVGAGGAGGTTAGTNGSNGGSSSFGSVLTAGGGAGGGGDAAASAAPASANIPLGGVSSGSACLNPNAAGESGQQGWFDTVTLIHTGRGANTKYGTGGIRNNLSGGGNGFAADGYGSGGSGGGNGVSQGAGRPGGAGAGGIVIIYEYSR